MKKFNNKKMTYLENLVIRACKSNSPETRLKSIQRRYYLIDKENPKQNEYNYYIIFTGILNNIVKNITPSSKSSFENFSSHLEMHVLNDHPLFSRTHPFEDKKYSALDIKKMILNFLIYTVRFTKVDEFNEKTMLLNTKELKALIYINGGQELVKEKIYKFLLDNKLT